MNKDKWISVKDELPKKVFVDYLVWPYPDFTYGDSYTAEYQGDGKFVVHQEDSFTTYSQEYSPKYWQPLPESPE